MSLYGATPRLGKVTKGGNDIMSRHAGECFAEVVFESESGRYRCHWEQRRARKKPGEKLQTQKHKIADADSGTIIEDQIKKVSAVIEEKTGLDFDRFTRSVLLAQGDFDAFLKAEEGLHVGGTDVVCSPDGDTVEEGLCNPKPATCGPSLVHPRVSARMWGF